MVRMLWRTLYWSTNSLTTTSQFITLTITPRRYPRERKLGSSEHDRYSNYIQPKHSRDNNFVETVDIFKKFLMSALYFLIFVLTIWTLQNVIQLTSRRMQAPSTKSVSGLKFQESIIEVSYIYMLVEVRMWCRGSNENSAKNRAESRHYKKL